MDSIGADDREPGEGAGTGKPTWAVLKALWRDRDVQYAQGARALTESQINTIRNFRLKEVSDLCPEEQGRAGIAVLAWYPPSHGQGTGDDINHAPGLAGWRPR